MPEVEQKTFQRHVAHKVRISDILDCNFVKDDFSAGHIKLDDANVSRVNILATIIHKFEQGLSFYSAVIDDGTGRISLRSFENANPLSKADVGDIILMIGKIREFNSEKYVMPEIIKKINNTLWLNVRKLELNSKRVVIEDKNTDTKVEDVADYATNNDEEIYSIIRKLDEGHGVPIDDVIKSSNNGEVESTITKLLENGDIFEIKPGRLKVLE